MNIEKQAAKIREQIKQITAQKTPVISTWRLVDESVQAELRLRAEWTITAPVDTISYPKDLNPDHPNKDLWSQMFDLSREISKTANQKEIKTPGGWETTHIKINEKTKSGPERRAEEKGLFVIKTGKQFLADYKATIKKSNLAKIRKTVTDLQIQQKDVLPKLRESNSAYLAGKKNEKETQKSRNAEALKTGRFWEADKETLKGYFNPPFDKNFVADVSEKWRACLILECGSESWKDNNGNWRFKLVGTRRGYLCGIDDNGDEWGYTVNGLPQSRDYYGNAALDSTVEEAMTGIFDISVKAIPGCYRQGDLLFHPESIPADREIKPAAQWEPRESHIIMSEGFEHNGTYFRSANDITVTHTSHPTIVLPAGEYRLYMSGIADAD